VGKRKRNKKARRRRQGRTPDAKGRSKVGHGSSPPRRGDDAKVLIGAARGLIQLGIWITGIIVVLKFVADAPGYAIVASVLAAAISAYDLFDVANFKRAKYVFVAKLRRLVVSYACCLLAMLGLVAAGIFTRGRWWEALIIVLAFVSITFARREVETKTCQRLAELGLEEGEPLWFKGLRGRLEHITETWADWSPDESTRLWQLAMRELASRLRSGLDGPVASVRGLVALVAMIASMVLGAWAGLATAERAYKVIEGSSRTSAQAPPAESRAAEDGGGVLDAEGAPSEANDASSSEAAQSSTPLSDCAVPPGTGAPRWARADIFHLYLGGPGISEPPGTLIAGCPSRYHTINTQSGPFVYTIGEDPDDGRSLSVAVDSSRGPALFLAPAVRPVLSLIGQLGAVGGSRRFNVGTGQFYPVQTDRGTYLLIRHETGTEQAAAPFEVIPPVVTQAWAATVAKAGRFLWPRHGVGRIYYFDTGLSERAYTFVDETNQREPELSEDELASLARTPE
jgi:hypothetical protein